MFVLFIHTCKNFLFGCVVVFINLTLNIDRIVHVSTRRHGDEEIYRVFCYFEDGINTVKINKLLVIPRHTVSL